MKIIGHHTCDGKGSLVDIAEIAAYGPFLSMHEEPDKHKMLGTGYYFFDNNMAVAHAHGKNRYKRQYHIFEAELALDDAIFLDLVGNRISIMYIQTVMQKFKPYTGEKWTLGSLIEFLKEKHKEESPKGVFPFPFKAIRVVDNSIEDDEQKSKGIKEDFRIYFFPDKDKYVNLSPIFTVCLLEKGASLIQSFKHKTTYP